MRAPRRIVASAPRRMRSRRIRPNTTAEAPPTSTALPSNSPSKKNGLPRTTASPAWDVPLGMEREPSSAELSGANPRIRSRTRARIARLPVMRVERLIRGPASAATRTGVEARGTLSEPPREERGRRDGRNAPGPRPADLPGGEGTRSHDPGRELPLEARGRRRHNTLIQNEFHATIPLQLLRSGRQDVLNAGAGALVHLDPLYDVLGQKISKGLSGPEELVLDRAEGHALELGDLLVRHLAVVTKADELAVVVGQTVDGRREGLAKPQAGELLVRIRSRLGRIPGARLAILPGWALERQEADSPPPQVIDRRVPGDPEQPGGKLETRVERVERAIHFDEDVLRDVAGILDVVRETLHIPRNAHPIAVHEDGVELRVARKDELDELCVLARIGRRHDEMVSYRPASGR